MQINVELEDGDSGPLRADIGSTSVDTGPLQADTDPLSVDIVLAAS
ncbi:MAG TPA: hypothetical protein VH988_26020 [Thermoanaerobaculia bacterium]|jgi:hypothetical protein|nr:hypothetical protein [Thermoanaerobaculia bacterium]